MSVHQPDGGSAQTHRSVPPKPPAEGRRIGLSRSAEREFARVAEADVEKAQWMRGESCFGGNLSP